LRDLAARGVPIVPTRWLARGRQVGLAQLLRDERWGDAVVKPAVSASGDRHVAYLRRERPAPTKAGSRSCSEPQT